ncbi:MAG: hypothetical protein AAFQ40_13165 [Cyanobacteria bacterium J06623_5]
MCDVSALTERERRPAEEPGNRPAGGQPGRPSGSGASPGFSEAAEQLGVSLDELTPPQQQPGQPGPPPRT